METKKDAADIVGALLIFAGLAVLASEPAAGISHANILATNITAVLVGIIGAAILILSQHDYGRQEHH